MLGAIPAVLEVILPAGDLLAGDILVEDILGDIRMGDIQTGEAILAHIRAKSRLLQEEDLVLLQVKNQVILHLTGFTQMVHRRTIKTKANLLPDTASFSAITTPEMSLPH